MIIVTGSVITKPDKHQHLLDISIEHCQRSRAELGCVAHNVHTDCENSSMLVFVEYWTDMTALKAHFRVPESREFVVRLNELAAEPPEMKIFSAEDVTHN